MIKHSMDERVLPLKSGLSTELIAPLHGSFSSSNQSRSISELASDVQDPQAVI